MSCCQNRFRTGSLSVMLSECHVVRIDSEQVLSVSCCQNVMLSEYVQNMFPQCHVVRICSSSNMLSDSRHNQTTCIMRTHSEVRERTRSVTNPLQPLAAKITHTQRTHTVLLHNRTRLQHTETHCNTPKHTATHRNTLQHIAAVRRGCPKIEID